MSEDGLLKMEEYGSEKMAFVLHGDSSELASCRRVTRYGGTRSEWYCRGKLQIYPRLSISNFLSAR